MLSLLEIGNNVMSYLIRTISLKLFICNNKTTTLFQKCLYRRVGILTKENTLCYIPKHNFVNRIDVQLVAKWTQKFLMFLVVAFCIYYVYNNIYIKFSFFKA